MDAEDDAPEESVEDEDGEGDEEPDNVGQVYIAKVVVSEEDGEADDHWEGEAAQGEDAVEDEPGEEGGAVVSESPTHQHTVDCDGQQGENHLAGQGGVGLTSLVQLWPVPETQIFLYSARITSWYHPLIVKKQKGIEYVRRLALFIN